VMRVLLLNPSPRGEVAHPDKKKGESEIIRKKWKSGQKDAALNGVKGDFFNQQVRRLRTTHFPPPTTAYEAAGRKRGEKGGGETRGAGS